MGFLLDGRIQHFNGDVEQIVIDRFEVSEAGGRIAKLRKTYMSASGAYSGYGTPIWALYRKVRSMYDSCTRKCGTYELNTTRRQHCMIKCRVRKYEAQLAAAEKTGNKTEIDKSKAALLKVQATLKKSIASFKSRGADE